MSRSLIPPLMAAAIGVFSGIYIWKEPLEQYSANNGGVPAPSSLPGKDGAATDAAAAAPAPAAPATAVAAAPALQADTPPVPKARGKAESESA